MGIDALTCSIMDLYRPALDDLESWGCNCPAQFNSALRHSEVCAITPIYADMVANCLDGESPRELSDDIAHVRGLMVLTPIKCAICKRERFGRDLDVICRLGGEIMMAVCTEHNRKGSVGWVYARG